MTTIAAHLSRIELLPPGRLSLTLREDPLDTGKYIYREAAEIEWVAETRSFISPRPELGPPLKHFAHVAQAAKAECGYELVTDSATEWVNVSRDDQIAIERFRSSPGA